MSVRACPYCDGSGCSECDETGECHVTTIHVKGCMAHIRGSAPLSDETREALAAGLRGLLSSDCTCGNGEAEEDRGAVLRCPVHGIGPDAFAPEGPR